MLGKPFVACGRGGPFLYPQPPQNKHSLEVWKLQCNYDDLYSTVSSKLLLGSFTRLLNIKAKSQISNMKKKSKSKV